METISRNISDLQPAERQAAETLLGRSLAGFQKVVVRVMDGGTDVVVRFFGGERGRGGPSAPGTWAVPASFSVLTDLSDAERADYDAAMSTSLKLSDNS